MAVSMAIEDRVSRALNREILTPDDVKTAIEILRDYAATNGGTADTAGHMVEDDMFETVLEAIAKGNPHAKELAIEVLKSREIKKSYYYE
jgi:hypothetical protein